jgi:phosphate transport system substrate-binding protein
MFEISISKRNLGQGFNPPFPSLIKGGGGALRDSKFGFGIYLGFGIWNLRLLFFGLLFLLLVLAGGCQRSGAGMTVAGSTSVEPFAELLAEEYIIHHPKSHIYVQGGGSTAGIEAVRTGTAQVGMVSRSLIGEERNLFAVTIAKDAIAVIVHPSNPVSSLTLKQIVQVFSGNVQNWKELGGRPSPVVLVTREEGSGTREAFQKLVMREEEISLGALVQDSNGAIRQVVASDPNAVGYISLGLVNDKVKALRIFGVEPTPSNIEKEAYKLVRPFLFVFNGKPDGEAASFLAFVLSARAQKLLAKEGLVSVLPEGKVEGHGAKR